MPKKQIHIFLEPELLDTLKQAAKDRRIPVSQLIRETLWTYSDELNNL